MKIIILSDTHSCETPPKYPRSGYVHQNLVVPGGDVLLHCGDLTKDGTPFQIMKAGAWFSSFPHKHKLYLAGNHDFAFERDRTAMEAHFPGCTYLENSGIEIDGVKFWGSPAQPTFHHWAFNYDRGHSIRKIWEQIPEDTNVLATHGPPMWILDKVFDDHVGCEDLFDTIFTRLKQLKLHAFGHIHCGYGEIEYDGIKFRNAAIEGPMGKLNAPLVVDL